MHISTTIDINMVIFKVLNFISFKTNRSVDEQVSTFINIYQMRAVFVYKFESEELNLKCAALRSFAFRVANPGNQLKPWFLLF